MENQHFINTLFKELEEKGVRDNMSGGEWIEDDVAANWDLVKKFAEEQYTHAKEGADDPRRYLNILSKQVSREFKVYSNKKEWKGCVYPLSVLGETVGFQAYANYKGGWTPQSALLWLLALGATTAYFAVDGLYRGRKRKKQQRDSPRFIEAVEVFGELKVTGVFQAISNAYCGVLESE